MISFLLTIILSLVLIPVLKKFKIDQVLSEYLKREHGSKKDTPTMGGLILQPL
jgi:UDP-N-acetylmuramyl pentapeptide phosphotransferase/UDP-N-acetylglucosamine-1-phosphate transferase